MTGIVGTHDKRTRPGYGAGHGPNSTTFKVGRGSRRHQPDPLIEAARRARIAAGISQAELAERSGYDRQLICDWERGAVVPGLLRFREVCQAIGLRIVLEPANA